MPAELIPFLESNIKSIFWGQFSYPFCTRLTLNNVNTCSQIRYINPKNADPMKPIEYLYFNIYNHFYQRNANSHDFYPRIISMYSFSLSVGGWILVLEASYLRMIRHSWFSSKPFASLFATSVYLISALIFHNIFIVKERDRKIFLKYEDAWNRSPYKKRDLLISLFVIAAPYVLALTLAIFFPHN
jgi:hypothetical protein